MTRLALVATVAFTAVAAAPSQTPQNPSTAPGTIFKNKAPVSHEILRVTLPKPKEADLPNGLHLLVLEDHRAPLVYFQVIIDGAGGYYDPADQPGLAGFTAALMREGTASKTSEQISQDLDRLAAAVNVGAGAASPFALVTGSGLNDNVDTVLAILSDVLLHPTFPDAEIARFKTRMRAQLTAQRSQPNFLAQERVSRAIFGDHPGAHISPTLQSLEALSRDALVSFHDAHYVPDHAVMAISGDITLEQAKTRVAAALGGWKKSGDAAPQTTDPAPIAGPTISLIGRPASVQTTLLVGTQSIARNDPDYDALTVANRVLGGPSQRLFEHLREQKGYTYGAGSSFSPGLYRGPWIAYTDVRTAVTDPALTDLLAEIAQMRDTPVSGDELANNKRAIVAGFARSLEDPNTVLNSYIESYVYKLPPNYWDTYPDRIDHITAADVQRVAQKYWAADRLQIVAVGDATKVDPILQKLGTVQEFDAEGKPIKQ